MLSHQSLIPGLVKGGFSSLVWRVAVPGPVKSRTAQHSPPMLFNTWFGWAPAVTWVMDINTDPSVSRITDPNMTTSRDLGPDVSRP